MLGDMCETVPQNRSETAARELHRTEWEEEKALYWLSCGPEFADLWAPHDAAAEEWDGPCEEQEVMMEIGGCVQCDLWRGRSSEDGRRRSNEESDWQSASEEEEEEAERADEGPVGQMHYYPSGLLAGMVHGREGELVDMSLVGSTALPVGPLPQDHPMSGTTDDL